MHVRRYFRTLTCVPKVFKTRLHRNMARSPHILNLDNLNPNVKVMEYAVRGPLVIRASAIEKELEEGVKKPFTEVIKANIGDCHAMGQIPITFIRQVLACVTYPPLMSDPSIPEDVKARARSIMSACRGGSVGSYTEASGIESVRKHVAEYIARRDGAACDWQNVLLCGGASDGIRKLLRLFIFSENGKKTGVMTPIPQYPLYSATLAEYGMHQIGYYLDESQNWGINIEELEKSLTEARKICTPRILVVINPGNPTGQVLSRQNIEEIIKLAHREHLYLLADEVYQDNIYVEDAEFHSFKKVLVEMGDPYDKMELASFMSCSKGYMGECGLRGGYAEVINMHPEVKKMHLKANTAMLCPSVLGQACLDAVVCPPKENEPSYPLYIEEKKAVLGSLKERAKMVVDTFNAIEGFRCNEVQGAMYAFPQLQLPPGAIEAAREAGQPPDTFYAFQLLESTGVCVVPGSGFGQQPGTFHFRTTILPQTDQLKVMLDKFKDFHGEFLQKYG